MRTLITIAAIGVITSIGLAQSKTNSVDTANELLSKVIKTYAYAGALTDTITIKYDVTGEPSGDETNMTLVMDMAAGNSQFDAGGMVITALDGQLYLDSADIKKKYFQTELDTDVPTTMMKIFGGGGGLPFHYSMLTSMTVDDLTTALNLGGILNLAVTSVKPITTDDGKSRMAITMTGDNDGSMVVYIDPKTNLIRRTTSTFSPPMPPGADPLTITMNSTYTPTLLDELPEQITFDPAGRKMVSSITDMQPTPLAVGDEAPDFTLTTNTGDEITLSELRGDVVILDFWATWCGPCKVGLPLLEKFYTWAKESENTVHVFGINVWERGKTADDRKKMALDFWTQQKFTMPTLLDLESSVVSEFGVGAIPATFIIAPDGTVSAVHVGFDPKMVETLKADTSKAMKKAATTG